MKKNLIEAWRSGARTGHKIANVKRELERFGFVLEQTKKGHWKAHHKGLPRPGYVPINAHAFGHQGEIHAIAIRDILKALDWLGVSE
jgi:hypothetical protein